MTATKPRFYDSGRWIDADDVVHRAFDPKDRPMRRAPHQEEEELDWTLQYRINHVINGSECAGAKNIDHDYVIRSSYEGGLCNDEYVHMVSVQSPIDDVHMKCLKTIRSGQSNLTVFGGDINGSLLTFDLLHGRSRSIKIHDGPITFIDYSLNHSTRSMIVTASLDGTIKGTCPEIRAKNDGMDIVKRELDPNCVLPKDTDYKFWSHRGYLAMRPSYTRISFYRNLLGYQPLLRPAKRSGIIGTKFPDAYIPGFYCVLAGNSETNKSYNHFCGNEIGQILTVDDRYAGLVDQTVISHAEAPVVSIQGDPNSPLIYSVSHDGFARLHDKYLMTMVKPHKHRYEGGELIQSLYMPAYGAAYSINQNGKSGSYATIAGNSVDLTTYIKTDWSQMPELSSSDGMFRYSSTLKNTAVQQPLLATNHVFIPRNGLQFTNEHTLGLLIDPLTGYISSQLSDRMFRGDAWDVHPTSTNGQDLIISFGTFNMLQELRVWCLTKSIQI